MTHSVDTTKRAIVRREKRKGPARAYTDYLFPKPTFWFGVASVFDLFGRLETYNYSRTKEEADLRGLYADYYVVGQDFWDTMQGLKLDCHDKPKQYRLFDPPIKLNTPVD
jgi:hypothetical protein